MSRIIDFPKIFYVQTTISYILYYNIEVVGDSNVTHKSNRVMQRSDDIGIKIAQMLESTVYI